jgi:hypothetical protein
MRRPPSISRSKEGKLRLAARLPQSFTFLLVAAAISLAQSPPPNDATAAPVAVSATADNRILGVIPNYQTVSNPAQNVTPLSVKQKFELFLKETGDPFTILSGAAGAALSQADNDDPKYGQGSGPYAQRFGAAVADITTQNFFSDAVLASLLHEDPRYFRRGKEFRFWNRLGYALSRVAITQTDTRKPIFNYANIGGIALGIGLSNSYYPNRSVNGTEVAARFGTSLVASALSNILPEFWPDIRQKFFHHK